MSMQMAAAAFAAMLALAPAASAGPSPPRPSLAPFPQHDGFVYPGERGSYGMAGELERWDAFNNSRHRVTSSRWKNDVAWMIGEWDVRLRDYVLQPHRAGMDVRPIGTATIGWAPQGRWLKIEVIAPQRYAARFLAYDGESRRWIWRDIFAPGVDVETSYATAWTAHRLRFGARTIDFHGYRTRDRITIVKDAPDRFRIVSEMHTSAGRWVAADDYLFVRRGRRSDRGS